MLYRYTIISKSEESPVERRLSERAIEACALKLQIDDVPAVHFIQEAPSGHIRFDRRIDGYCAATGRYICIHRGLGPKLTVGTTIHEMRHAYQCQDAKRHKQSVELR